MELGIVLLAMSKAYDILINELSILGIRITAVNRKSENFTTLFQSVHAFSSICRKLSRARGSGFTFTVLGLMNRVKSKYDM